MIARHKAVSITLVILGVLAGLMYFEARTSWGQAAILSAYAKEIDFSVRTGPSDRIRFPSTGPYDVRFGYAAMPGILERMSERPYRITAQARITDRFDKAAEWGIYPLYREKNQAGLRVVDRFGATFYQVKYPRHVYTEFEDVPELVWRTLLYIENRDLLDPDLPFQNPAVEWSRLSRAIVDQALGKLGISHAGAGASTLATQLEKLRHSPGGFTESAPEKMRQMATASLRSYQDGPRTMDAQRRIVRDYLNAMPLAAVAGHGEVTGLIDGRWAWYGVNVEEADIALHGSTDTPETGDLAAQALAYRQVLSLLLADRRPSFFLRDPDGQAELEKSVDGFLRILARDGVITPSLRDAALQSDAPIRPRQSLLDSTSFVDRKASNAVRAELLGLLGAPGLYDLDHYDVTVASTFDAPVQEAITARLAGMKDRDFVRKNQFLGERLLTYGDPTRVSYAIVVYEAAEEGNLVRVQTDNFDGPFDINKGSKLELGSTAKLRTLVTYLQIVESLHGQFSARTPDRLRSMVGVEPDSITSWALRYLIHHPGAPMGDMLAASLERRYSANPYEAFYTGGAPHVFQNFSADDDSLYLSVSDAFRRSVNLVFIRLMRDVVSYHIRALPGDPLEMLDHVGDSRRAETLSQFADREGRVFMRTFYTRYRGKTEADSWIEFRAQHRLSTRRLAIAYRSVRQEADQGAFAVFIRTNADSSLSDQSIAGLYERGDPQAYSWQDRGYLAGVHPLELWTLRYLLQHPDESWEAVADAGAEARRESYRWIQDSPDMQAQNIRILAVLEETAFKAIHAGWARLGYPFGSLVPSLATAIGSSADRPDALAELVGIVLRDGMRYPSLQISEVHLGADTPFETVFQADPPRPTRVLSTEVAAAVHRSMIDVVEHGTAIRAKGALTLSDGTIPTIGGKTGTGDNRRDRFDRQGMLVSSRAINRTATFVFFLGDRLFGVVTAFVSGTDADDYRFTSSLPAQIFKLLAPEMRPLFEPPATPEPADVAPMWANPTVLASDRIRTRPTDR